MFLFGHFYVPDRRSLSYPIYRKLIVPERIHSCNTTIMHYLQLGSLSSSASRLSLRILKISQISRVCLLYEPELHLMNRSHNDRARDLNAYLQTAKFEGDQRTNYRFATTHTEAAPTARSLPLGPPPPRRTRTSKDKAAAADDDGDEEADVNAGGG